MELSILVAQIVAVVYISIGVGLLLNGDYYRKVFDAMISEKGTMYLGGALALVVGFLLVKNHNIWEMDWTVLVTIIGWGALLKGILLLVLPEFALKLFTPMMKCKKLGIMGTVCIVLGLVLGYYGFGI
ncbi:hypothetical protein KAI58_01355 [Candidatus Gracilibacteria bacterium]|nr:hypothetical protein [Candidatus Gracilibacteria bacterium]